MRSLLVATLAFVPGCGALAVPAKGPVPAGVGANGWNAGAFEELDRSSEKAGWPARHHSPGYAEARKPAYRVLTGKEAERLVLAGGGSK